MQRYLLVLDTDLSIADEELHGGPFGVPAAGHGQEPAEVVVVSLTHVPRGSTMELLLGAGISIGTVVPVLGRAPRPDHDVGAAAEHRMHRAVQQLNRIGCRATGIVSDSDMLEAVRAETRAHDYDQVILATSGRGGPWLARLLCRDPVHRLRRRFKQRLTVLPVPTGTERLLGQAGGQGIPRPLRPGGPPGCNISSRSRQLPIRAAHHETCRQPDRK